MLLRIPGDLTGKRVSQKPLRAEARSPRFLNSCAISRVIGPLQFVYPGDKNRDKSCLLNRARHDRILHSPGTRSGQRS
jgi:hypothetical protein